MNQRFNRFHKKISSSDIEERLKAAIERKNQIEENYRSNSQKYWTIVFIDVSSSSIKLWEKGETFANKTLADYQNHVRNILSENEACFVEQGGGPQIVCCFDDPVQALLVSQKILLSMNQWNNQQVFKLDLLPAVGINQGYIVYEDGVIHQSNTSNLAKRIQTEAKPGEIFVSSETYNNLKNDSRFTFQFVKQASLKNIPIPQKIYRVRFPEELESSPQKKNSTSEHLQQLLSSQTSEKKTHNWCIIHIDVCESTKKFWHFGDREASQLIREYQKVCHTTFKSCGCKFVKSCEGDQIFAGFARDETYNAVMASIKILQWLFRRNANVSTNKQIRAAIGIHAGSVILQGNDLVQTKDMRIGKWIQSEAAADEILLSDRISALLASDLEEYIESRGKHSAPDIPGYIHIFNLSWFRVPVKLKTTTPSRRSNRTSNHYR